MKTVKHTFIVTLSMVFMFTFFICITVFADENPDAIISVPLTVKENYNLANDLFKYINKNRINAGEQEYLLDEGLTEMAMERAAELCIYFNHSSLISSNTALTDKELSNPLIGTKFSYSSEDILDGTADAESTYKVWYNSNTHVRVAKSA